MTPERWRQIEELYHAARERTPAECEAFLADADPELRKEVESLLAQNSRDVKLERAPLEVLDNTVTHTPAGSQLGPYRIENPIGEGGMGKVFRATDTRLGRAVAIKTSQAQFSERFEREARAISALNHPHICTLHDVGPNYLVMELVEGETLAARLKRGKLALADTLKYGAQIADALAAAHAKGIVHRDLKPGNIMVTKSGVKVLDFGLAKSRQDATLTATHAVVGTPAYMAPEQFEGKEADPATDIYALGLVLYEMATGKRAPQGEMPLLEGVAPQLRPLIEGCLARDPAERWHSARDLKIQMEAIVRLPKEASADPVRPRVGYVGWVAAALIAAIALGAYYRSLRPAELKPLVRLDVDLGPDAAALGGAILSPDGSRIVYRSQGKLFTRRLDQSQITELPGTSTGNPNNAFFSPDGKWLAFIVQGKVGKVSLEGGQSIELCPAAFGGGGSWGENGIIVASLGYPRTGLSRIPADGGAPEPITALRAGESHHTWPQILPGGKAVLFSASGDAGDKIEVVSLYDRKVKTVQEGGASGRYVAGRNGSGYLVYFRNGILFAVPFDLEQLVVRGTSVPVLEGVATVSRFWGPDGGEFNLSQDGTMVYRVGGAAGNNLTSLQWLDGIGKMEPLIANSANYNRPRFSPDGQRLALEMRQGASAEVWVYDLQRKSMTQLTFDGNGVPFRVPTWTPDGRFLVFGGNGGLYWMRADGVGKPQALTQSKNMQVPYSFTPDGKRVAWDELDSTRFRGLWTMEVTNTGDGLRGGKPEVFVETLSDAHAPVFSPDGRWLAYHSNESGGFETYVRAFPDNGGKRQISVKGGAFPVWARNGRELFFSAAGHVLVATYTAKGDSFVADPPRVWSPVAMESPAFEVSPDGKRIVAQVRAETSESQRPANHIVFLLNFYDELRRKVPVN